MKILIATTLFAGLAVSVATGFAQAASSAADPSGPRAELRTVPRPQSAERRSYERDHVDMRPAVRFVSVRGDEAPVRRFSLNMPLVLGIFR